MRIQHSDTRIYKIWNKRGRNELVKIQLVPPPILFETIEIIEKSFCHPERN